MNRTNFVNPAYLLRIKAAIAKAVTESHRHESGIGSAIVLNRRGNESLEVIAHAGKGIDIFGGPDLDDDVTDLALAGLRDYHDEQRAKRRARPIARHYPPSQAPIWPCPYDASAWPKADGWWTPGESAQGPQS